MRYPPPSDRCYLRGVNGGCPGPRRQGGRLRKAVARRARLYSPMVGSRQSNLRSDNPHPTAAPPVLRPSVKFFAIFARILTAANTITLSGWHSLIFVR